MQPNKGQSTLESMDRSRKWDAFASMYKRFHACLLLNSQHTQDKNSDGGRALLSPPLLA
jgi:hypothetical protein